MEFVWKEPQTTTVRVVCVERVWKWARLAKLCCAFCRHVCHLRVILSVDSLPTRSITSSKANSPQSASYCYLFQFPISSLFLKINQ